MSIDGYCRHTVIETVAGRECEDCGERFAPVRYHCPECGMKMYSIKPPGLLPIAGYRGRVMARPCCCVFDVGLLRAASE